MGRQSRAGSRVRAGAGAAVRGGPQARPWSRIVTLRDLLGVRRVVPAVICRPRPRVRATHTQTHNHAQTQTHTRCDPDGLDPTRARSGAGHRRSRTSPSPLRTHSSLFIEVSPASAPSCSIPSIHPSSSLSLPPRPPLPSSVHSSGPPGRTEPRAPWAQGGEQGGHGRCAAADEAGAQT